MRAPPSDKYDREELKRLNCESWMVKYLDLNPEYVHWGPGEDYMCSKSDGWSASQEVASWAAFGPWGLDELNECVHFYFELARNSEKCTACDQSGWNPETKVISDTFYDHGNYRIDFVEWKVYGTPPARGSRGASGRKWIDAITEDELQALKDAGRIKAHATLEDVNIANGDDDAARRAASVRIGGLGVIGHDAINQSILIETRAKRLGFYGKCPNCDGHGYVHTEPAGHLNLVVWMIHPRKGASRGVRVQNLSKHDASAAIKWLAKAATRNAERFSKVVSK